METENFDRLYRTIDLGKGGFIERRGAAGIAEALRRVLRVSEDSR